ncbi:unnamed protein product [Didymodactylos carnosus]|uniref:Transposase n=1 Tax=Didymodactylos carnosus TaxID=1234261 RepID=A0A815V1X3_9BILA|nr:unnamed protein product [Didymodactylos carnosus]CAF4381122.1 unnamed protein product [Didymodactylos carnosus]
MPFTRVCVECVERPQLKLYELNRFTLFDESSVDTCSVWYGYCTCCKCSYYCNSLSYSGSKCNFVTRESFKFNEFIYFHGISTVYHQRVMISFVSALLSMCSSVSGFVKWYNDKLDIYQKYSFSGGTSSSRSVSKQSRKTDEKHFQINFLMYEIIKFIFMFIEVDRIEIPISFTNADDANMFFYQWKDRCYAAFVRFWMEHKKIFGSVCNGRSPHHLCSKHIKQLNLALDENALRFEKSDDLNGIDQCNIKRHKLMNHSGRKSSYGILMSFLNCGLVVGFDESIRSESPRRLLRHLIRMAKISMIPRGVVYDNACSIKLYMDANYGGDYFQRSSVSDYLMNEVHFVLGRFHEKTHVRHMYITVMPDKLVITAKMAQRIVNSRKRAITLRNLATFNDRREITCHSHTALVWDDSFTDEELLRLCEEAERALHNDKNTLVNKEKSSRTKAMGKSETHLVDGDVWSFRLDDKPLMDVDYNESRFDTPVLLVNTICDGTVAGVLGVTERNVITTNASENDSVIESDSSVENGEPLLAESMPYIAYGKMTVIGDELTVPEQNGLSLLATTSAVTSFTAANHEYPMLKNIAAETTDIVGVTASKQSSDLKRSSEENVVYLKYW